jgi:hypothetical protein
MYIIINDNILSLDLILLIYKFYIFGIPSMQNIGGYFIFVINVNLNSRIYLFF